MKVTLVVGFKREKNAETGKITFTPETLYTGSKVSEAEVIWKDARLSGDYTNVDLLHNPRARRTWSKRTKFDIRLDDSFGPSTPVEYPSLRQPKGPLERVSEFVVRELPAVEEAPLSEGPLKAAPKGSPASKAKKSPK